MALKDLERQYGRDPKSRKFFPLAEEYARMGNLEKAIELLQKGLIIHPSYVGARVSLGRMLIQLDKTDIGQRPNVFMYRTLVLEITRE